MDGDRWFGFEAVRSLKGLPPEILIVPLPGHTRGHCAVAVHTGDRWLLHAGDGYFHHGSIDPGGRCPPGVDVFQRFMAMDREALLANQERLRTLAAEHRDEVSVFCAHDAFELSALSRGENPR